MNNIILTGIGVKDWVKGDITHVVRNESGDWTQDLCDYEPQKFKFDTNECAQLSSINSVETQCNYLKRTKQFSDEAIKWFEDNGYFDENGRFDFSERFTAILAGCSINGSSQWWAWQSMSKYGLLPWKDLHYTMEESEKFDTQEAMCKDYYNPSAITQAMKDKAIQALKYIDIQYEWLRNGGVDVGDFDGDFKKELQQSPIGVGVPICSNAGWNSGTPGVCSIQIAHHAVMQYNQTDKDYKIIWDHYHPASKTLPPGYTVFLAIKGYVTPTPINIFKHTFYLDVKEGDASNEVSNLQTALIALGYKIPSIQNNSTIKGFYGKETRAAVYAFQLDYVAKQSLWAWFEVIVANRGKYCSSFTRKALNTFFG